MVCQEKESLFNKTEPDPNKEPRMYREVTAVCLLKLRSLFSLYSCLIIFLSDIRILILDSSDEVYKTYKVLQKSKQASIFR